MRRKLTIGCILGLLFCCGFSYQNSFLEKLQEKLFSYYETNLPLKITLFFNQPAYTPSDTAYFRVSLLRASDLKPVSGFAIINIDLTDYKGAVVYAQKIKIKDGIGSNQIAIPSTIEPGIYTIVAYNDWMKNHDASLLSFYEIRIAGEKLLTQNERSFDFDFFAEGGHLVEGITNKIVFTGPPFEKVILNSSTGHAFSEVKLNAHGLGFFFLTPLKNTLYSASLGIETKKLKIEKEGIGLLTTFSVVDSTTKVILQVSENSVLRDQTVYFVWSSNDHIYYEASINFQKNTRGLINIPGKYAPKELSLITIFNSSGSVIAQRVVKLPQLSSAPIKIDTDRSVYNTREKITVTLDGSSMGKSTVWMTVFNTELFEPEELEVYRKQAHQTFLNFPFNGLTMPNGILETPGFVTMNDFLITQQWKGFLWEDVLNGRVKDKFDFGNYLFIKGRAINPYGETFPDSTQIGFFLQKQVTPYHTYLTKNGDFNLLMPLDFYDDEEIYCRVVDRNNNNLKNVRLEIFRDTAVSRINRRFGWLSETSKYFTFSEMRNNLNRIFSASLGTINTSGGLNWNALIENEVSGVDFTIKLKDYVLFSTMKETLLELVPHLVSQTTRDGALVRLWLDDKSTPTHDPLYVIDGVLTDDSEYFMSLLPENVVSIKLIRNRDRLRRIGVFGNHGVVLVETTIHKNYLNVPRGKNTFSMRGFTKPALKRSFQPENLGKRTPHFESTLYFNPNLVLDKNGRMSVSFYTADNPGNYKIYVQGLSSEGKSFTAEHDFQVRYKPHEN